MVSRTELSRCHQSDGMVYSNLSLGTS